MQRTQRTQWIIRGLFLVSIALLLSLVSQTLFVKDVTSRIIGVIDRPVLLTSQDINERSELVFSSRSELIKRVKDLENQLTEVALNAREWGEAESQLDLTLTLLEYREKSEIPIVTARVLFQERLGQDRYLIINRGENDGIRIGDPVIVDDGILIGEIDEVRNNSSRIAIITNQSTRLGASPIGATETYGVIEGGIFPLVQLKFVPRHAGLKINDVIITSGVDPQIPHGLLIGLVNALDKEDDDAFSTVYIEPLADSLHRSFVGILVTKKYD
jgi:rod shape-determining protein MreC